MTTRIINAPHPDVLQMLQRRMPPHGRAWVQANRVDSIGLTQLPVMDLFYFSDIALKSADVFTVELYGSCPQHITSLAVMGETSSVRMAMEAIAAAQDSGF